MSTYCMPSATLCDGDIAMSETSKLLSLLELINRRGEKKIK